MIRQHSNVRNADVLPDVESSNDVQSSCLSSGGGPDVVGCCRVAKEAKSVQPSNKFDQDVYLVPGSSPSEKARCHYLQIRTVKEKPVK